MCVSVTPMHHKNSDPEMCLLGYLDGIVAKGEKFTTVYVALGSAAHMLEKKDDGVYTLDPQYNQQYPTFLHNLKSRYPLDPLHIFLMDPTLEHKPWIVCDPTRTRLGPDYDDDKYDDNLYHAPDFNTHVYEFAHTVVCPTDSQAKGKLLRDQVYLNTFFSRLNECAIQFNWFVVVHDFRGSDNGKLAAFYDKFLGDHRNHIIYGLAARENNGCYIELIEPKCDFVFEKNAVGIFVFNPFNFDENQNKLKIIKKEYDMAYKENPNPQTQRERDIIQSQITIFYNTKLAHIINNVMTCYRQVASLEKGSYLTIAPRNYSYIKNTYGINVVFMLNTMEYGALLAQILPIVEKELYAILIPLYGINTHLIVDPLIASIQAEPSPYNWETLVRAQLAKSWNFDE